jgi:endonuclease YncB( thermonuclease family)
VRPETLLTMVMAAGVGGIIGMSPIASGSSGFLQAPHVRSCSAVDGDTLRCGAERIRLLGIDAPEMRGHCRTGRTCVDGDPIASTASLRRALTENMIIYRAGQDRYGRTLAAVAGARGDLSCWQLKHGQALYMRQWDRDLRIARTCPAQALGS